MQRGELSAARLSRLHRALRYPLLFFFFAWASWLLIFPLALILAPFDLPGLLPAGRFHAALERHIVAVSAAFAVPLAVVLALDEDPASWRTMRGGAGRVATWIIIAPVCFVFGMLPPFAIFQLAAPLLANAILRPPVQAWTVPIIELSIHAPAPRTCTRRIFFDDPIISGHRLDLCVANDPEFKDIQPNDGLRIVGRNGPFGITWSRIEALKGR